MHLLTNLELEVTGKTKYENQLSGNLNEVLASRVWGFIFRKPPTTGLGLITFLLT